MRLRLDASLGNLNGHTDLDEEAWHYSETGSLAWHRLSTFIHILATDGGEVDRNGMRGESVVAASQRVSGCLRQRDGAWMPCASGISLLQVM